MTILDDRGDRQPPQLDAFTAERMVLGLVSPDDAPEGYEGVARLVIAARRPPSPEEVAGIDAAVFAALLVLREGERDRSPQLGAVARARRFVKLKVASAVFVGTMVGTTGLAAAGVLPEPIQHAAATVLGTVGIEVPDPANHGQEVSDIARNSDATGRDQGKEVSEAARGNGRSDEPHGRSDEPHGRSDEPHGRSDEPHGRSDEPHGRSDEPHGRSDEPHGRSDEPHGRSDEERGKPDEERGKPEEPGDDRSNGPDASAPPTEEPEEPADPGSDPGNGNGNGNGDGGDAGDNGNDGGNAGVNGNGGDPNDVEG